MAKLTNGERRKLQDRDFALPGTRQFPIPNRAHAEQALRELHTATPRDQSAIRRAIAARYPEIDQTKVITKDARDRPAKLI